MTRFAYVDASALAKLVLLESDSAAMVHWHVESERIVTSRVGIIETRRAAARHDHDAAHLDVVLRSLETLELDAAIAQAAAVVAPLTLRSLDAIHLASASAMMPEIDAFVTYDARLADAARALGLPVISPA